MANYTAAEIRAFRIKDVFQARMSALKASTMNNEGKAKKPASIMKEADGYFDWLMQEQDPIPEKVTKADPTPTTESPKQDEVKTSKPNSDSSKVLPKPATADENKILKIIFEKLGANSQAEKEATAWKVLGWAEDVHGVKRYPSMESSVDEVVKYISK